MFKSSAFRKADGEEGEPNTKMRLDRRSHLNAGGQPFGALASSAAP